MISSKGLGVVVPVEQVDLKKLFWEIIELLSASMGSI